MLTQILAKAICLYYLVMGIAVLVNRKRFITLCLEIMNSPALMLFSGVVALILGLVLISLHNVWVVGLPVLVTLVGWLAFAKGATLLIAPNALYDFTRKLYTQQNVSYIGYLLLALAALFGYISFS